VTDKETSEEQPQRRASSARSTPEAPVTEKAVPATPPTQTFSQYVVTVDDQTGTVTKIEKLTPETGERKELSADEYAASFVCAVAGAQYAAAPYAVMTGAASSENDALVLAYFQGVADYLKALNPGG
jgi:hypothetical protein